MKVEHVPLLQIQRDLFAMPRNYERFQTYLRTFAAPDGTVALPPLVAMNPMGKEHNLALLDDYLALGAEAVTARAVEEAAPRVEHVRGEWKLGLVIVDDLGGGWTNRYATEYTFRFSDSKEPEALPRWLACAWINVPLWTTEPASADGVRQAVLTAIYRIGYIVEHGPARTLRERMEQEGHAMAMAGCAMPALDPDDLEYTRAVLAEHLDATDMRTTIECLWGDAAGKTLGLTPRGLSDGAGLALALHDARRG
jgi:hypothetical protein